MNLKNFRFLAVCAFSSFFLISVVTSCKKSNDNSTPSGPFSATIGGQPFVPTTTVGEYDPNFNYLFITGTQLKAPDSTVFYVRIPFPVHAHDTISFGDDVEMWYDKYTSGTRVINQGGNFFDPTDGYVIVDTYDGTNRKISGSFHGILRQGDLDSMVVSNGHFNTTWAAQ